ncbi:hypothetical protein E3P92_00583 [Wallemia ichthyophaga]|uniref:C2H2-type domain-containing protein n=1 Tax=Wallemia ichthyophaga TaxID=245174 RepID=A0A4T0EZL8_WALIC|nr:hypothetical protein E3P98_02615 [Wallemia ichthyophaga]TIA93240.1 hypothetical protein E3P97_00973 [Wallemia ichthyophaga]TIB16647.1 hypothetical protein E3P90_00340 [Wallemia ichthyophaga]TIB18354.1 hypothetical protein E3P93_00197 [Wallemia ichthyophaga]TIB18457.1 hypothetical protein E3P92_00583 [Wallemia ichthyophaga]
MFDFSNAATLTPPELSHSPSPSVESSPLLSVPAYMPAPPPKTSASPTQLALIEADSWFTSLEYLNDSPVSGYSFTPYDLAPSPPQFYSFPPPQLAPPPYEHSQPLIDVYTGSAPIAQKSPSTSSTNSDSSSLNSSGPGPVRRFSCPKCHRAFARHFNLKQHLETHNPMRIKPFLCHHPECGKRFSRKHDLVRHQVSIHHKSANSDCSGRCTAKHSHTDSNFNQESRYIIE